MVISIASALLSIVIEKATHEVLHEEFQHRIPYYCQREKAGPRKYRLQHVPQEELVQATWLKVLEEHPYYDPKKSSLRTWMLGVAKWTSWEFVRKREAGAPDESFEEIDRKAGDNTGKMREGGHVPCPKTINHEGRVHQKLFARELLAKLPEKEQAILRHAFYDGMTDPEIAELYDNLDMRHKDAVALIQEIRLRGLQRIRSIVQAPVVKRKPQRVTRIRTEIENIGISQATATVLRKNGVQTLSALLALSDRELIKMRGIQRARHMEIRNKVQDAGLKLGNG